MKTTNHLAQIKLLLITAASLWLLGCSTTIKSPVANNTLEQQLGASENKINDLLKTLGDKTSEK